MLRNRCSERLRKVCDVHTKLPKMARSSQFKQPRMVYPPCTAIPEGLGIWSQWLRSPPLRGMLPVSAGLELRKITLASGVAKDTAEASVVIASRRPSYARLNTTSTGLQLSNGAKRSPPIIPRCIRLPTKCRGKRRPINLGMCLSLFWRAEKKDNSSILFLDRDSLQSAPRTKHFSKTIATPQV